MAEAGSRTQWGMDLLFLFPIIIAAIVLIDIDGSSFPLPAGTLRSLGFCDFGRYA